MSEHSERLKHDETRTGFIIIDGGEQPDFRELQSYVGGPLEIHRFKGTRLDGTLYGAHQFICNEEARMFGHPINPKASRFMAEHLPHLSIWGGVYGNALVLRNGSQLT